MSILNGSVKDDVMVGTDRADEIFGFEGNDIIHGGKGKDKLYGGGGNDTLSGEDDEDELYGGEGNDTLDGGNGADKLFGGNGNDIYYIKDNADFIQDESGLDTAYVSANFVKIPGNIENIIYMDGAQALPYWIDALVANNAFQNFLGNAKTWYYAFPSVIPSYISNLDDANGWTPFTTIQKSRTKEALELIASFFNLNFVETKNTDALNTIVFASNDQSYSSGYATLPSTNSSGSDVFLSADDINKSLDDGSYGAWVLMHELGHALGLKNVFSNSTGTSSSEFPPYLSGSEDSTAWSYMSDKLSSDQYAFNYSPFDIAALQYIYGPSTKTRTGDDSYVISQGSANFIWDGAGTDTLDASTLTQGATLYLTPGYWGFVGSAKTSSISAAGQVTVNFGSAIENIMGSAHADNLYGNELANVIHGGAGNDLIDGGSGNDRIIGEAGDDKVTGGAGIDTVQFSGDRSQYEVSIEKTAVRIADKTIANDGTDLLSGIERLKFADKGLALDVDGNAGTVAKIIGAVFGKQAIENKVYVGIGLSFLDSNWSYDNLAALALDAAGAKNNDQVVTLLWTNIIGFAPSVDDKRPYIQMLENGMSVGALAQMAADSSFNTAGINLVGLALSGIEYTEL